MKKKKRIRRRKKNIRNITIVCSFILALAVVGVAAALAVVLTMGTGSSHSEEILQAGLVEEMPMKQPVAAVSAGIVQNVPMLDLCYEEDSSAMVDLNCVMSEDGLLIELQGTGEERPFTVEEQQELVRLCHKGIMELTKLQKQYLEDAE